MPQSSVRRSFVYRLLAAHGASFAEDEVAAARSLALVDLSLLPRIGFKGAGAHAWLRTQGITGLDADNRAHRQTEGEIAVRLAPGEALILGAITGEDGLCRRLEAAWSGDETTRCYPVLRGDSHFWSVVCGTNAAPMLAKLCGVDLRPDGFVEGAVAQTSVARINALIVRADVGTVPAFHILGDSALAEYYWQSVIDAMAEFEGRLVGVAALTDI